MLRSEIPNSGRAALLRIAVLLALAVSVPSLARAHAPWLLLTDNEDGTFDVAAGFSNGNSAAGYPLVLKAKDGKVLWKGKLNAESECTCPKQQAGTWSSSTAARDTR